DEMKEGLERITKLMLERYGPDWRILPQHVERVCRSLTNWKPYPRPTEWNPITALAWGMSEWCAEYPSTDTREYQRITINDGEVVGLHEFFVLIEDGERASERGLETLHLCNNPRCPLHCFAGTHELNMLQRQMEGRQSKKFDDQLVADVLRAHKGGWSLAELVIQFPKI